MTLEGSSHMTKLNVNKLLERSEKLFFMCFKLHVFSYVSKIKDYINFGLWYVLFHYSVMQQTCR